MKHLLRAMLWAWLGLCLVVSAPGQPIVINEIMYHPASQNVREEYVELFNKSATNVNLSGWRISGGIDYLIPANTILGAGSYLVVAADPATLDEKYPSIANLIGGWLSFTVTNVLDRSFTNFSPVLSNTRNSINLKDSTGTEIDSVTYADDGDWAVRQRSRSYSGQRGWVWTAEHDGLGKSLELINPALRNDSGQNWAPSLVVDGTPGEVNSVRAANIAPLIIDAKHLPLVPRSTDPVNITARIVDESMAGLVATLFFRTNVASPPPFVSTTMFDDGAHGDGAAGDGIYGARLAPMPNGTLIEFYVQAADAQANTRTWPAPAREAADLGGGSLGQAANALLQVDDSTYSSPAPLYKLIITAAETAQLQAIFSADNSFLSIDAQVNATFISVDGADVESRYLTGIRNRGHGSRAGSPHNYRVNLPSATPWKGVTGLNLNARTVPAQVVGAAIAQKAGVAGNNSHFAQLRVNNGAGPGGTPPNSLYAANEDIDGDWSDRSYPDNGGGNIYSVVRDIRPPNFDYRGESKSSYTNTYFKGSNVSEDEWSDLMGMLQVMGENQTATFTTARARAVINVEQWLAHLAVMNLFGNNESGINTGNNDDYYLYRGLNDPRFILVYHDLDTVLGLGGSKSPSDPNIFSATVCCASGDTEGIAKAMNSFMHHAEIQPLYYRTLQDLLDGPLSQGQFNSVVDEIFAAFPELASTASGIKSWMDIRRATVLPLISDFVPAPVIVPLAFVSGEPRSPTPATGASLGVSGLGLTHYRYKLNNGSFGSETPVATPITLNNLANGSSNVIAVIGRNAGGTWQETPTLSKPWVVNTSLPSVRLNEVLAKNELALDHFGTFPDAIELYNEGGSTVDLSGLRLTDDPGDPGKFSFPAGTTLAAGTYLVVYANNPDGTPGIHLGFSLGQNGGIVQLRHRVSSGGGLIDQVQFGLQLTDSSIGRLAGISGDWSLTQPTFGGANFAQATGSQTALKINEWFAASEPPLSEDYVELFNPGSLPVALEGLYLSDQPLGRPAADRIAALSFIGPGGFSVFTADGQADAGAEHVNFRLTSDVGSIGLFDRRLAILDCVTYGPQRSGFSMGRCPDGGSSIVTHGIRTPGAPNYCPVPPPPPQLVNLVPIGNTWRYNQNTNLDGVNWQNPAFDDSGWPLGAALLGVISSGSVPEPIQTPLSVGGGRITYYFRSSFVVADGFAPSSLQFSNLIDDGAVFYLNGQEVGRYNMPSGPISNLTPASANLGGPPVWTGPIAVAVTNIHAGLNTIGVEVHQSMASSADVVFGTRLDGVITAAAATGVVLNEVLADNAGINSVAGRTPDWIELYNSAASAVDLVGLSLNDQANNSPPRWVFPPGSIIPAGGYLVIYADSDLPVSSTNTGFGLKANGGSVYLFDKEPNPNSILDRIDYGLQTPDLAIGRVPSGSGNWVLTLPTPGATNVPAVLGDPLLLRINEWMANPVSGDDWFEIYNGDSRPISLGGLVLTDTLGSPSPYRIPPLSFIGVSSNAFVQFDADNPSSPSGPEHVNFKLDKDGDSIFLLTANSAAQIDAVAFGSQPLGVSRGRLPDGATNFVFFPETPTPKNVNFLPLATVVVNEVLAHTDLPLEDAIELRNTTAQPVNIGNWWLSDANHTPRKFHIPADTTIPANGFKVFYELQFNSDINGVPFSLNSAKGDQVYLCQSDSGGQLTGYRAVADFGPSANGVSFGRYVNSQGIVDYPPLSALTFGTNVTAQSPPSQIDVFRTGQGATNASPKVGPIVISEIMYHPPDVIVPGVSTNDNLLEEFIELHNPGISTAPLYDPLHSTNTWRLREAVDFDFPASSSIPPGGYLIVVSFDPVANPTALASFRARYGSNCVVVGPYSGKLDNSSERIELYKPDPPQTTGDDAGKVPYVLVEKVTYTDRAPWPPAADGLGASLQRLSMSGYGNDATNWIAGLPSPGPFGDSDGDGMPDSWEDQYGFLKNNPGDADQDFDLDGMTNLEEYLAGTHPKQAGSTLRLTPTQNGNTTELRFTAMAGRTYTILYCDTLAAAVFWQRLTDVPAQSVTQTVLVPDNSAVGRNQRFYRIVTPANP